MIKNLENFLKGYIIKIDKYIKDNTIINTPYDDYYNMILKIKRYIYDTKIKLGLLFSNNEELTKYIEEIVLDKIKSRYIKIKTIQEILKTNLSDFNNNEYAKKIASMDQIFNEIYRECNYSFDINKSTNSLNNLFIS